MVRVDVKWQSSSYPGVEVDASLPPSAFKAQLASLTGVPVSGQKVLGFKGGLLKDDADWSKVGLREGMRVTLMGAAPASVLAAPAQRQTFVEDLPPEKRDETGLAKYGAGLENMGNTCYANSTIQCLYRIDELREALAGPGAKSSSSLVVRTLRLLFAKLKASAAPVTPLEFLFTLRAQFPQFSQQTREGYFMQQDAEECWSSVVIALRDGLPDAEARAVGSAGAGAGGSAAAATASESGPSLPPSAAPRALPPSGAPPPAGNAIDRLMEIELRGTLRCEETGEEIPTASSAYALKCNITSEVNALQDGLRLGLRDDVERASEALGRPAPFVGSSRIASAPKYLPVQMVRFFYKQDVGKAKILRKVAFPATLDAYEFFAPEVQERMKQARDALQAQEDARVGVGKAGAKKKKDGTDKDGEEEKEKEKNEKSQANPAEAKESSAPETSPTPASASASAAMAVDEAATAPAGAKAPTSSSSSSSLVPQKRSLPSPACPTGRYELVAVLTHKGRSADSGHYVAWVREDDGTWILFDDAQMIPKKEEDILALSGGGDWHMAYMLLYKSIDYVPDDTKP